MYADICYEINWDHKFSEIHSLLSLIVTMNGYGISINTAVLETSKNNNKYVIILNTFYKSDLDNRALETNSLNELIKKNEELLTQILNTARGINESLYGKFVSALVDGVSVSVNDREVARLVRRYA